MLHYLFLTSIPRFKASRFQSLVSLSESFVLLLLQLVIIVDDEDIENACSL